MTPADCIVPDWPAPANVRALITTRAGGVSVGPYASMNPADHVGDEPSAVASNRALLLRGLLPNEPHWLNQVHGTEVFEANSHRETVPPRADACISRVPNQVCVVLTADCLPVFLCDADGTVVGVAHAGWRGLRAGVIERTVAAMKVPAEGLLAYLGPAIGPAAFEVGEEVRAAFMAADPAAVAAFTPGTAAGKWMADLYLLARQRLANLGIAQVAGGGACTHSDPTRYFSYRRDGATGRLASLIWLDS
jgi:YfiH family protein